MAQRFRALTDLPKGPGSVPSTHIRGFTIAYNSNSQIQDLLLSEGTHTETVIHTVVCGTHTHTHTQRETNTNTNNIFS
jgi:hypothetical protein